MQMSSHLHFILPFLLFAAAGVAAQPCQTVGAVDFRNAVISATAPPLPESTLDRRFRFTNGIFDETEEPGGTVEWRYRISKDLMVHPDLDTTIRFLQISGEHLRGTGTRNYVMAFRCVEGQVNKVFQSAGEGLVLTFATSDLLQLSSPVWKNSDARCCPSEEKKTSLLWDNASGRYVEQGSTITPLI